MSFLWNIQSFLDDVFTGVQDTVERAIYDPSSPIEGIKDIIEERERNREIKRIEKKVEDGTFFEKEEENEGLLQELVDACVELKNSLEEIFTVGAYEMLIKGNSDWKTSSDLMDEASQLVEEAITAYEHKYSETKQLLESINCYVEETNKKKASLAEKLKKCINVEDEKLTLNRSNMVSPVFKKIYATPSPIIDISCITFRPIDFVSITGFSHMPTRLALASASGVSRIHLAKENLEEAKDFVVRVKLKLAKLQDISVRIQEVKNVLDEENKALDTLLPEPLNNCEAYIYAKQLRMLLTEEVICEDGSLNVNYRMAVESLKRAMGIT